MLKIMLFFSFSFLKTRFTFTFFIILITGCTSIFFNISDGTLFVPQSFGNKCQRTVSLAQGIFLGEFQKDR